MSEQDHKWVILGRVTGLFGVRGWVKLLSYTSPRTNILEYTSCYLDRAGEWKACEILEGRSQGKGIISRFKGLENREQAAELIGSDIAVRRDQLPELEAGAYYWTDLENVLVQTLGGRELGRVGRLFETGSNDVLVVEGDRQRLLPYIDNVIRTVDLERGLIIVDWDPDF